MKFLELGLNDILAEKCRSLNFTEPTPIQKKAIPIILEGEDLIGCAETGTGKTAAFLLPTIQKLLAEKKPGVRVLIVAPTRELASQIAEAYIELSTEKLLCVNLIGGANMKKQVNALRRGVRVVIGTPGRINDHIERGNLDLSTVETLVLDEADRMLDMGFLPQIRKILAKVPNKRQSLLFSATMSDSVKSLAYTVMQNPEVVEVSRQNRTARTVEQVAYKVATPSKTALLLHLLETNDFEKVLVFTRTKRAAERLAHILTAREIKTSEIHSDRTQSNRERALQDFRDGKIRVLVATDIASRGIDVDSVTHVINYDVPEPPEDYVHRVGRTGRAGKLGQAMTFVTPVEELAIKQIERLTQQKIERIELPEFNQTIASSDISKMFSKSGKPKNQQNQARGRSSKPSRRRASR
ncbi:MAG: DEAD/DEAH box helicase [Acidobacteriota bacterium]|nr:DEAD/DEAH box helicase [Acidobacteriota bacterium]MDH3529369.1 DEAD/DEAH box helicase [Acidobacteriota bacterium]